MALRDRFDRPESPILGHILEFYVFIVLVFP